MSTRVGSSAPASMMNPGIRIGTSAGAAASAGIRSVCTRMSVTTASRPTPSASANDSGGTGIGGHRLLLDRALCADEQLAERVERARGRHDEREARGAAEEQGEQEQQHDELEHRHERRRRADGPEAEAREQRARGDEGAQPPPAAAGDQRPERHRGDREQQERRRRQREALGAGQGHGIRAHRSTARPARRRRRIARLPPTGAVRCDGRRSAAARRDPRPGVADLGRSPHAHDPPVGLLEQVEHVARDALGREHDGRLEHRTQGDEVAGVLLVGIDEDREARGARLASPLPRLGRDATRARRARGAGPARRRRARSSSSVRSPPGMRYPPS